VIANLYLDLTAVKAFAEMQEELMRPTMEAFAAMQSELMRPTVEAALAAMQGQLARSAMAPLSNLFGGNHDGQEHREALRQTPISAPAPPKAKRRRARAADPQEIVEREKAFLAAGGLAKEFAKEVNLHPRTIRNYRKLCGE